MARFVNTLVNTEERPRIKDPIADITYDVDDDNDYDDEQPSETTMTMNENIVCKFLLNRFQYFRFLNISIIFKWMQ